jgi:hypothetical protein
MEVEVEKLHGMDGSWFGHGAHAGSVHEKDDVQKGLRTIRGMPQGLRSALLNPGSSAIPGNQRRERGVARR